MYRWRWAYIANRRPFNAFIEYEVGTGIKIAIGFVEKTWRTMPVCFML